MFFILTAALSLVHTQIFFTSYIGVNYNSLPIWHITLAFPDLIRWSTACFRTFVTFLNCSSCNWWSFTNCGWFSLITTWARWFFITYSYVSQQCLLVSEILVGEFNIDRNVWSEWGSAHHSTFLFDLVRYGNRIL